MEPTLMGFAVFDRCPIDGVISIAHGIDMVPLGGLTAGSLLALVSAVIDKPAQSDVLAGHYIEAHQCSALRALLPGADFEQAYESWKANAEVHYLPVLHWMRPPADPLFVGIVNLATGEWRISTRLQRRSWQLAQRPSLQEYYGLAVQIVAVDRMTRLLLSLFQDFMRDMHADNAILRAWALLESLGQIVPESEVKGETAGRVPRRVRLALERMGVHKTDFSVAELDAKYAASGQDTVTAVYQRRNCLAHEGSCNRANSRCSEAKYRDGACREVERLRDDLEWLIQFALYGYVRNVADERGIGLYVGSRGTKRYHASDCPGATRIKPGNSVLFKSSQDAQIEDFVPCKRCLSHVPVEDPHTFVVSSF
ncbi:MAG: hypothetical protein ACYC6C_07585 [Coriobacteriia bacterium]